MIENPVSGESVVWLARTDHCVRWEHRLRPGGGVPLDHVHPVQHERFEVLEGTATFRRGRERVRLGAGESIEIPAGTAHGFRNETTADVRLLCEVRPALRFVDYLETIFALARDGKVTRRGMAGPLRSAVMVRELGEVAFLPHVPFAVQRAGAALLAPVGKLLGHRGTYP